ncbi:hypothetical protein RRG08_065803 [Elysia crispata]|uniref:Uncharacterized protein n=1 Tax=Elysia crispata TaxID=231223 RepID=A0AAE0ZRA8_9GAST|nr:hypothetical protein RRG08_065803 [Elysia crispata]
MKVAIAVYDPVGHLGSVKLIVKNESFRFSLAFVCNSSFPVVWINKQPHGQEQQQENWEIPKLREGQGRENILYRNALDWIRHRNERV